MKKLVYIKVFLFAVFMICLTTLITSCSKKITLQYEAEFGGYILGGVKQSLAYGEDGLEVQAVPNVGYEFIGWSDGYDSPIRKESNVKLSKKYIAKFAPLPAIKLNYLSSVGGKIFGIVSQEVLPGLLASQVDAIADIGYEFVGWDDGLNTSWRIDKAVNDLSVTAIFKKIEYSVEYAVANEGGTISGDLIQTIKYDENGQTVTAVPKQGYEFIGWSDGVASATRSELSVKNNIQVRAVFARKKALHFPILMVFFTEVHASLELKNGSYFQADYSMTEKEKRVYDLISLKLVAMLNDFFAGEVVFEADTYYTKESISRENMTRGTDAWSNYEYGVDTENVPELSGLKNNYRCIINTLFLMDNNFIVHSSSGSAGRKEAQIYADNFIGSLYGQNTTAEFLMDLTDPEVQRWWNSILETYIHEFTHTAEMYFAYHNFEEIKMGLHDVISYYNSNGEYGLDTFKLYLLKQALIDGQIVGIPKEFWFEEPNW